MPRRYVVVRPDRSAREFFLSELEQGRLREGWGWLPEQDLTRVAAKLAKGEPLSKPEASAWRNRRLLHTQPDGLKPDDIVIVPNLPTQGRWVLARVTGGYRYEISEHGDYGHIVEVELFRTSDGKPAVVEADNKQVHARLRATMRGMSRIWGIDDLGPHVEILIAAIREGKDTTSTEPATEKVARVLAAARSATVTAIDAGFKAAELEQLAFALLSRIYDGRVQHRGGPSEKGADLVAYARDALGLEYLVGIQVKCYQGTHGDFQALEQIKQARIVHSIDSGVVITTAEKVTPEFEARRNALEAELKIDIKIITRDELVDLVLQHLSAPTPPED
jgi:predicted Mrr-cat superfamily restriction endonuclease